MDQTTAACAEKKYIFVLILQQGLAEWFLNGGAGGGGVGWAFRPL